MSDYLQPHEMQHARPPCPSPTPGVHSDSRPSSRWCHQLAISSSVVPFSSCPQSLRVFSKESTLHMRWPKYWSFSFSISPSNDYSGLISFRWTGWIFLQSKGDSQESSPTPQFKSINSSWHSAFFIVQLSHPFMTTGKTIAMTRQTFDGKVTTWDLCRHF